MARRRELASSADEARKLGHVHVASDEAGQVVRIGERLRLARKKKGLSLDAAASALNISASQVSRIERGQQRVSVNDLLAFATYYGKPVTDFFLDQEAGPISITRRTERIRSVRNVTTSGTVIQEQLLNSGNVLMEPALIYVPVGADSGETHTHDGEGFLTVIGGEIRLWVGEEEFGLAQGDTIYYHSTAPHRWINDGGLPAIVLAVNTPPSY